MTSSRRTGFFLVLFLIFQASNAQEGRSLGSGGYQVAAQSGESRFQAAKDLELASFCRETLKPLCRKARQAIRWAKNADLKAALSLNFLEMS